MSTAPTLVLRSVKASALTSTEVDNNFSASLAFSVEQESRLDVVANPNGSLKRPLVVRGSAASTPTASVAPNAQTYTYTGLSGTYATLANMVGVVFLLRADATNYGPTPATLSLNGFAATQIVKHNSQPLLAGDIQQNQECVITYDGVYFILHNPASATRSNYFGQSAGANANTLTVTPTAYGMELPTALYTGFMASFRAGSTNTGPATFQILQGTVYPAGTGLNAALAIQRNGNALTGYEIVSGQTYEVVYDGAVWQLKGATMLPGAGTGYYSALSASGPLNPLVMHTWTHGLGATPRMYRVVAVLANANDAATAYNIGDEVEIYSFTSATNPAMAVTANATTITLCPNTAILSLNKKDTGAVTAVTVEANWTPKVYAWL